MSAIEIYELHSKSLEAVTTNTNSNVVATYDEDISPNIGWTISMTEAQAREIPIQDFNQSEIAFHEDLYAVLTKELTDQPLEDFRNDDIILNNEIKPIDEVGSEETQAKTGHHKSTYIEWMGRRYASAEEAAFDCIIHDASSEWTQEGILRQVKVKGKDENGNDVYIRPDMIRDGKAIEYHPIILYGRRWGNTIGDFDSITRFKAYQFIKKNPHISKAIKREFKRMEQERLKAYLSNKKMQVIMSSKEFEDIDEVVFLSSPEDIYYFLKREIESRPESIRSNYSLPKTVEGFTNTFKKLVSQILEDNKK